MRPSRIPSRPTLRAALLALGLVALPAAAAPAAAQLTVEGQGAGAVTRATLAADHFVPVFSFRITGFAPGATGPSLFGGTGDCLPGDACQTAGPGLLPSPGFGYGMVVSMERPIVNEGPHVGLLNPGGAPEGHLLLPRGALPPGRLDRIWLSFGGTTVGTLRLTNLTIEHLPPQFTDPLPPVLPVAFDGTAGAGTDATRHAVLRSARDLRGGFYLNFDAVTSGLTADGGSPVIDVYVGTSTVPEPGTTALVVTGLAALGGVALRRRRAAA